MPIEIFSFIQLLVDRRSSCIHLRNLEHGKIQILAADSSVKINVTSANPTPWVQPQHICIFLTSPFSLDWLATARFTTQNRRVKPILGNKERGYSLPYITRIWRPSLWHLETAEAHRPLTPNCHVQRRHYVCKTKCRNSLCSCFNKKKPIDFA
jgi:hypothetical protein